MCHLLFLQLPSPNLVRLKDGTQYNIRYYKQCMLDKVEHRCYYDNSQFEELILNIYQEY